MKKIKWENLSNNEITIEQIKLKEEYESLKNQILLKYDEIDEIDKEYIKSINILNERLKK